MAFNLNIGPNEKGQCIFPPLPFFYSLSRKFLLQIYISKFNLEI